MILLRALAGVAVESADREAFTIEWEGAPYRVAPNETRFERLVEIRRRQGRSLDAALDVADKTALAQGRSAIDTVRSGVERLRRLAGEGHLSREIEDLSIRSARLSASEARTAPAIAVAIAELGDRLLAESMSSVVYATALAEAAEWLPDARDLDLRHDLTSEGSSSDRSHASWELPVEVSGPDVRWHFAGSVLGIDLALAPLRLRRISNEPPDRAPKLNENDRRTFVQSIALLNPVLLTNEDRDAIRGALERGRTRVDRLADHPDEARAAAIEAGMSAWRTHAAQWTARHEPGRLRAMWSMRELLALGQERTSVRFDRWGLSARPVDGSLRTLLCEAEPWEDVAGRPMTGQLASFAPDLNLRMAEALALRGMPAELAPEALAPAVQNLVDEAQPAYMDDWLSIVAYIRNLPDSRFDDYLASLTADGPLVPSPTAVRTGSR
jgi:hypothetical protein